MGLISVAELLSDPDFCQDIDILRRAASVASATGRNVIVETADTIVGSVQGAKGETLETLPEGVRLKDVLTIYTASRLNAEAVDGIGDIILDGGRRYLVYAIEANFRRFGMNRAVCVAEKVRAS